MTGYLPPPLRSNTSYNNYVNSQVLHSMNARIYGPSANSTPQVDHALISFKNGFSQTTIDKIRPSELFKLLQKVEASDLSLQTADGYPLLHVAIQLKFDDEAIQLMDKGANPAQLAKNGQNALHVATAQGLNKVVNACMYRGVSLQSRNSSGKTPFQVALDNGNYSLAASIYTPDQKIDQIDAEGMTPFLKACQKGLNGIPRLFVSHGANIHALTPSGETALHLAVGNGDHEFVRYLIKKGISSEKQDRLGRTALTIAIGKQDLDMIELLAPQLIKMIPGGQKISAADAAKSGNQAVVAFWLSKGLNINADIENGYTMLHLATKTKQEALVQFLISQRASVESLNIGDARNSSPLMCAIENGSMALTQALLQAGADPNVSSQTGEYPLHKAICQTTTESRLGFVKCLLDKGALVNHPRANISFLFQAFIHNCLPTFTLLQEKGASATNTEIAKLTADFKKRLK